MTRPGEPRNFPLSRRIYRGLLRLYPREFRDAYGAEMESAFLASLRHLRWRKGRLGLAVAWLAVIWDTLTGSAALRLGTSRARTEVRRRRGRGPIGPLRSLAEDARSALRHLRRNPAFSLVAVGTLALGIGLNTAVFGAVYSLLLRPLPGVAHPEALVQVYRNMGTEVDFLPSSLPLFRDLRARQEVFTGVVAWTFAPLDASTGDRPERILGQIVSPGFFEVLGVPMALGRGLSGDGGAGDPGLREVVLSEGFWRSRFGGDPGVLGRTVSINGTSWEVVGVVPEGFRGPIPVVPPALWAPLSRHAELMGGPDQSENRGNNFLDVVARLEPGVALPQAEEWARLFAARLAEAYPEFHERLGLRLVPQREAGIHPALGAAQAGLSGVMMGVVGVLLLVACVNVASLFLAQAGFRRREMAVRRSIGGARRRIVTQLLFESLILALLAGGAGLLLAAWIVSLGNGIRVPLAFPMDWNLRLEPPVLAYALGISVLVSLAFGLVPALRSSDPALASSLRGGGTTGGRTPGRTGRVLLFGQVAVATVLLVCAGLFLRNLSDALEVDVGFSRDNVLLATLDPSRHGHDRPRTEEVYRDLSERVEARPDVEAVGLAASVPLGVAGSQRGIEVPGYVPGPGESLNIQVNTVDVGYFSAMGIPLLEGRGFQSSDGEPEGNALVVNQRFAERFWPGERAVGRRVRTAGTEWQVVGVVPTGKYRSLGESPRAFMYFPWPRMYASEMTLHARGPGDPASLAATLRSELGAIDADLPLYDVKTMEEHLALALLPARLAAVVLGVLGALCLALLTVGINGVVALSVARRTRELGIRVAVGAEPGTVARQALWKEVRVLGLGLLLGIGGGLGAGRLIRSILYSGEGFDVVALLSAPLLLLVASAVAAYGPARRAAGMDPSEALRTE